MAPCHPTHSEMLPADDQATRSYKIAQYNNKIIKILHDIYYFSLKQNRLNH